MTTLTLDQAAALMHTTPETVSDCIHNRGLPAARIGRAYVLVEADVIEWLRAQYGAWRKDKTACDSINEVPRAPGGLTSPTREASALAAALAPRTSGPRRNSPPRLRNVSGAKNVSEKLPA